MLVKNLWKVGDTGNLHENVCAQVIILRLENWKSSEVKRGFISYVHEVKKWCYVKCPIKACEITYNAEIPEIAYRGNWEDAK
jgi:hypothetical protein